MNAHIHSEAEEVPSPLVPTMRDLIILFHLVASVDAAHVVVERNNGKRGYFDVGAVSLLSSYGLIPDDSALSAEEGNSILSFQTEATTLPLRRKIDSLRRSGIGLHIGWEIFAICTRCSAQVQFVSKQIFCKLDQSKEIITNDVMILAKESSCQVINHSVTDSMFGLAINTASGVDLEFAGKTVAWIGPNPTFMPRFTGLHWHVLLGSKPAPVPNYCLLNAGVFGLPVFIDESPRKDTQPWPDLEQLVVARIVNL